MRVSASQIISFHEECKRKWAWKSIAGVSVPQHPSAALGEEVHAQLEKWLATGGMDFTKESAYIAAAGLHHLPKPQTPGMSLESEFHFVAPSGHSYSGRIDLIVAPQPGQHIGLVTDHKSRSDLKWAGTAESLRQDIQANLYAVEYFRRFPDEETVEARWVYYQTRKSKKSLNTSIEISQREAWEQFQRIEGITAVMAEIYENSKAIEDKSKVVLSLEPNPDMCSAYGGCPHQGRCNLDPFARLHSIANQDLIRMQIERKVIPMGSLLSKLKEGRAGATVVNGTAGPAATSEHLNVSVAAPASASNPPAPAPGGLMSQLRPAVAVAAPAVAAINPPEQHLPPAPPTNIEPEEHKKRARKSSKTDLAPKPEDPIPNRGPEAPAKNIGVLYVDCGPSGLPIVDATQIFQSARNRLAQGGIADWRYVDYGKGAGMFAEAVAAALDAGTWDGLRIDTGTDEVRVSFVEFQTRAGLVVR